MRTGELEQAIVVLQHTLRLYAKELRSVRFHATSTVDLAIDQALLGNVEAAEQSLALADASAEKGRVPSFPAMRAFTRAVIDCRGGNHLAAAKALDDHWTEFEVASTGEVMRLLRVVRAFARTAAGPREAGAASAQLDGLRPAYLGEFEFLGVAWPEMGQFLVTHQLSRPTAQPARSSLTSVEKRESTSASEGA